MKHYVQQFGREIFIVNDEAQKVFVFSLSSINVSLQNENKCYHFADLKSLRVEFFHNYRNTKLRDLVITSYFVFHMLNLLHSLIKFVEYTIQTSN